MSFELLYTSAPRGLRPGSMGFCTVGMTRGLPSALAERLEGLSGYRPIFSAQDHRAELNPVSLAHWRLSIGAQSFTVLSRICYAGLDYTHRANKFAHHLVLSVEEQPIAGPAWLLEQQGVMRLSWPGDAQEYDGGPMIPMGNQPPSRCTAWAAAVGDAGWAGTLVESFVTNPTRPAFLIYQPGMNLLPLLLEAIALIPEPQRWQATFNTYFTDLPAGVSCIWRCCVAGTAAANEARRLAQTSGHLLIDLNRRYSQAPDSVWVRSARTGIAVPPTVSIHRPQPPVETDDDAVASSFSPSPTAPILPDKPAPVPSAETDNWPLDDAPRIVAPQPKQLAAGRLSRFFWAVAVGWPVAVGLIVFSVWRSNGATHTQSAQSPQTVAATTQSAGELMNENQRLKERVDRLTDRLGREKAAEFSRGLAQGRAAPPDEKIWVKRFEVPATQPTAAGGHTDAEFLSLLAQLEQARAAAPIPPPSVSGNAVATVATAPASQAIVDESGRVLAQWIAMPDAQHRPEGDQTLAALPPSRPYKLVLDVPANAGSAYKVKNSGDSLRVYRSSGSGLGGTLDRANFFQADNALKVRWAIDASDAGALSLFFASAALHVGEPGAPDVAIVQFIEPERCDFNLSNRKKSFAAVKQSGAMRLVPLLHPSTFNVVTGAGSGAAITFQGSSGASFSLDADVKGVWSNWSEMVIDAARNKRQADEEVESLRYPLPKKPQSNDIDEARRADKVYDRAFAAYDQAVAKARLQGAMFEDLNRPLRAQLALVRANGVVVATIEVTKDAPR